MKPARLHDQGFTLIELMFAVAVGALMMAALVAAAVCLHRSFTAVDNYFASHVQQVRIMDYLSRDVKRSYIVTTSTDLQTVTCIIPNYLVNNGSNQPTRATPTLSLVGNKVVANYQASTVNNVTITQGSTNLTCPGLALVSSHFSNSNVGQSVVGTGIPPGTTIESVSSSSQATMSKAASTTNSSATVTIGALTNVVYSVVNQAIQRRENGGLTNIAASVDKLIPFTSDVELLNTEFTQSTVTFLPQFARGNQTFFDNERAGTTIFSLTYLRNRRRGDG
jgi:prepilin-type N-terminal cleavage/methylation domain-containing protein